MEKTGRNPTLRSRPVLLKSCMIRGTFPGKSHFPPGFSEENPKALSKTFSVLCPLDFFDVVLGLAPREHHLVPAALAAQTEVRPGAQDAPAGAAAGMWLLHDQNVVQPDVHGSLPLDLVPVALGGLLDLVVAIVVILRVLDKVGQVLLLHPVVRIAVRIEVALLALLPGAVGVDVLKLPREHADLSGAHVLQRSVNGQIAGVGLRRSGEENHGVCQRQTRLRHPELQGAVHAGLDDGNGHRIGKADVLAG